MPFSENNLIWIDLEMTGLVPSRDRIIEIATVVTNDQLKVIAEGPNLAIYQPKHILEKMDKWNRKHHSQSGLLERVTNSSVSELHAEQATLRFLKEHVPEGASPICGNSICQDRRFLRYYMPTLESYFHYRQLDVSSIKILVQRWAPHLLDKNIKSSEHRAKSDIIDSIEELKLYRNNFEYLKP